MVFKFLARATNSKTKKRSHKIAYLVVHFRWPLPRTCHLLPGCWWKFVFINGFVKACLDNYWTCVGASA